MLQGWKRYGHSCYVVTNHKHTFDEAELGYYCGAALVHVENRCLMEQTLKKFAAPSESVSPLLFLRFEQAFVNSLLSDSGANSSSFYWTGLADQENEGFYHPPHSYGFTPTFTNWNKHQPGYVSFLSL